MVDRKWGVRVGDGHAPRIRPGAACAPIFRSIIYARAVSARARTFSYDVSLDREWAASSALGGITIPNEEEEWTPEHLVLAGLCRCSLTSFRYHWTVNGEELQ